MRLHAYPIVLTLYAPRCEKRADHLALLANGVYKLLTDVQAGGAISDLRVLTYPLSVQVTCVVKNVEDNFTKDAEDTATGVRAVWDRAMEV